MRLLLRLLAGIWLATLVVTGSFAYLEIREERTRLEDDLVRRAVLTADAVREATERVAGRGPAAKLALWQRTAVRLGVLILLLTGITWVLVRWTVTRPIARMAEWTKQLKTGQPVAPPSDADASLFGPLAGEVTGLARTLTRVRAAAE